MPALIALTRDISDALTACELTHLPRAPIDLDRARAQHAGYERALEAIGCRVRRLPANAGIPDSVFIEDVAVVLDEVALITRPGAASRRAEVAAVAEALSGYRPLVRITSPGTLDGGDVLVVGRSIFVGRTSRTNDAGIDQLRSAVAHLDYSVRTASVRGCLHLKSAVTALDDETLLFSRRCASEQEFSGFALVDVDPTEPAGANIVSVGAHLLYASAYPRTRERLEQRGYSVTSIDVSELAKAEGAMTCCSLIFGDGPPTIVQNREPMDCAET